VTGYSSPTPRNWIGPPVIIPDSAKEKPQRGIVQAIGKKVENVKVGDQVLFDKYSGSKLRIEDEECLILKEEDILGVFAS